jgi:predicted transglutaminase-like cysteine proteinase
MGPANKNNRVFASVIAVVLLAILSLSAATPSLARSKAPLGYQLMCLKTPAECKGGGKSTVDGTPELMATIKHVNATVNAAITPRNDVGADVWTASASAGDCEDYVLAKRRALINAGVPASSLRIAYVQTRSGEGHAILVVHTSKGDFVLDNLNRTVRPLSQSGYRIISMSGADPQQWT